MLQKNMIGAPRNALCSHASTIVELSGGRLMAAWFAGSAEGNPDVSIWSSQTENGAWADPAELADEDGVACYNPVLFHTQDGRLWLYYKFGLHPDRWTAARCWSQDEGATWSDREYLPAGLYGPVRAKPLMTAEATVVSGTSVETYLSWACWIERSTDNGLSWSKIGPITVPEFYARKEFNSDAPLAVPGSADWFRTRGIIQPSVVSMGGQRLRLYARSTARIAKVCVADSEDAGLTWTQARPIEVPNPNSGIDAIGLSDGRVVLIYNHSESARTPLNLAVSRDGTSFDMFQTLEEQPGEYSYPAVIQSSDGNLHMTYTWNRERIVHACLGLSDVPEPFHTRITVAQ